MRDKGACGCPPGAAAAVAGRRAKYSCSGARGVSPRATIAAVAPAAAAAAAWDGKAPPVRHWASGGRAGGGGAASIDSSGEGDDDEEGAAVAGRFSGGTAPAAAPAASGLAGWGGKDETRGMEQDGAAGDTPFRALLLERRYQLWGGRPHWWSALWLLLCLLL